MPTRNRLFKLGAWCFLAAIALLIIRNNTYPWPIKRASDILLFLSLISVIAAFSFRTEGKQFLKTIRKPLIGLALLFAGIAVASFSNWGEGMVNGETLLSLSRFIEVAIIVVLVPLFLSRDQAFLKKAAIAQLSTLAYLPFLFTTQSSPQTLMARFQVFENWPSNVGYYLAVSLSVVIGTFLFRLSERSSKAVVPYLISAGFTGIFLWTQSRASWLGAMLGIGFLVITWTVKQQKTIGRTIGVYVLLASLPVFGFLLLPQTIQNIILLRIFPQPLYEETATGFAPPPIDFYHTTPGELVRAIAYGGAAPPVEDAGRFKLWQIYIERVAKHPFGEGLQYETVNLGYGDQGPHNTVLEILVIGGPLALAGFLYLFILAFRNLWRAITSTEWRWAAILFSSLLALTVASLFDNMSTFRLMWVVLGFSMFFPLHGRESTQDTREPNPRDSAPVATRAA